jgi:hypothetical protein
MTMKGFKKCCMVNAVEGTNDMLWNGSEEDGDISEYKDEGTDCEDGESDTDWTKPDDF